MKNILLLSLFLPLPILGMEKINACMVYCKPTKQDACNAVVQGSLIAAQMIGCHPKFSALVNSAKEKVLPVSFVAPALIAWNSEALTNGIMNQLPEMNTTATYCIGTGIQKTLLYGGSALTAYLLYTQTWDGLTKRGLAHIFSPQIKQARGIKQSAGITSSNAMEIKKSIIAFAQKLEQVKANELELEKNILAQHSNLTSRIHQLNESDKIQTQLLEQLNDLVKEVNVQELTDKIVAIERNQIEKNNEYWQKLQKSLRQMDARQTELNELLKIKDHAIIQRKNALKILANAMNEDIQTLMNSIADFAQNLHESKSLTHIARQYANRVSAALQVREQLLEDSNSDSDYITDDESESEISLAPRGIAGSSRSK
ncbi:MAG: hypothetical protein AMXMBFR12_06610 [Candidatus Babeliales bacterium]